MSESAQRFDSLAVGVLQVIVLFESDTRMRKDLVCHELHVVQRGTFDVVYGVRNGMQYDDLDWG